MPDVTLFVGPSAFGIDPSWLARGGVRLRPPVRRGDVDRLIAKARKPGVVLLCDGIFHAEPAVSHAEIGHALDRGWQVWGVSSIGAIRAYEMRSEGMRGFGYVRDLFDRFDDFRDDEMAHLYFPEAPYFPVSEPLVNLRYALERNRTAFGIGKRAEAILLRRLQAMWFGDRTLETVRTLMIDDAAIAPQAADRLLAWLPENRIKTLDLVALMTERPWIA